MEKKAEQFKNFVGKYRYVALVLLAGLLLLALPLGEEKSEAIAVQPIAERAAETQKEMEAILSQIDGVGELRLMLTLDCGAEQELAQDSELSYRGTPEAPEEYEQKTSTVVLSGSGGSEVAAPLRDRYPIYRGALVVCAGGERPQVKLDVSNAVAALTGLSRERISVVKWQE